MIVGLLLVIVGMLLTASMVGAVIGIPLMIVGAAVFLLATLKAGGKGVKEGARGWSKLFERPRVPCPFCAELIRPEAKICPHCRSALHTYRSAEPISPVAGPAQPTPVAFTPAPPARRKVGRAGLIVGGILAVLALLSTYRLMTAPPETLDADQLKSREDLSESWAALKASARNLGNTVAGGADYCTKEQYETDRVYTNITSPLISVPDAKGVTASVDDAGWQALDQSGRAKFARQIDCALAGPGKSFARVEINGIKSGKPLGVMRYGLLDD